MAKKYTGKFDYTTASDNYECKMSSGIPWWVWLIAGLVLAFIASLFIRWDRDMKVRVLDDLNRPIEQADVAVNYTARFFPWMKKDMALHGVTGKTGEVEIHGMTVSVWSYLFYHNEPVEVKGAKGNASDAKTVPLHSKDVVVLHLSAPAQKVSFDVRTIDAFTGEPVAGAELLLTVDGDGQPGIIRTDAAGKATISGVTDRSTVSVAARHPNYNPNDTTIYQESPINLRGKVTDIPLAPKVKCNQTVAHRTGQPHVEVDRIDLGQANVDFPFTYYTDWHPDHIRVYDENGNLIFDATDIATCNNTLTQIVHSPTRYIKVTVDTYNNAGQDSNWNFMVGCP